jgi:hypothetical protein
MDPTTFIFFHPWESIKGLIPKELFSLVDKHSTFHTSQFSKVVFAYITGSQKLNYFQLEI